MKVLFLDTNFFIQCQEPSQIPWDSSFPGEDKILLVIPKAVADEIDRQKQDGNNRRSRQARKANSFMRQIILADTGQVTIREEKPLVEVTFSPAELVSCSLPTFLDLGRADDQIVVEMLRYKATKPEQAPCLLSHDTNPMRTAKLCGLSFIETPDEWLLPPEPDTKDKRIQELERKVKELQNQGPQFEIVAIDEAKASVKNIVVDITYYPALTDEDIATFVGEAKERFPMEESFPKEGPKEEDNPFFGRPSLIGFGFRETFVPPSDLQISKYQWTFVHLGCPRQ